MREQITVRRWERRLITGLLFLDFNLAWWLFIAITVKVVAP